MVTPLTSIATLDWFSSLAPVGQSEKSRSSGVMGIYTLNVIALAYVF